LKKPKLEIFKKVEQGVNNGFNRIESELTKELYLNTPVDTGYLRDGAQFGSGGGNEITRKGFTMTIKNEAHYAPHVYFGTQKMEGRPWIETSLEKVNPQRIFEEEIGNALRQ
jgi:hypothetical protein